MCLLHVPCENVIVTHDMFILRDFPVYIYQLVLNGQYHMFAIRNASVYEFQILNDFCICYV